MYRRWPGVSRESGRSVSARVSFGCTIRRCFEESHKELEWLESFFNIPSGSISAIMNANGNAFSKEIHEAILRGFFEMGLLVEKVYQGMTRLIEVFFPPPRPRRQIRETLHARRPIVAGV